MRYGAFDLVAAAYALEVLGGVDELAMTWLDLPGASVPYATRYRDTDGRPIDIDALRTVWAAVAVTAARLPSPAIDYATAPTVDAFCDTVSAALGAPITIRSYGPTANDKRWSR
jgi:adenylosuccinate synthase